MYKCPNCGSTEDICVVVRAWAKLIQEEDNIQTDVDDVSCPDHDHYFDEQSIMCCTFCGVGGSTKDFEV